MLDFITVIVPDKLGAWLPSVKCLGVKTGYINLLVQSW